MGTCISDICESDYEFREREIYERTMRDDTLTPGQRAEHMLSFTLWPSEEQHRAYDNRNKAATIELFDASRDRRREIHQELYEKY